MQIISDLHLEHGYTGVLSDLIVPESPVLALLGDIGWPTEDSYQALLEYCSENFDLVIVLTGNHEYYCGSTEDHPATLSMMDTDNLIKKLCSRFDNVVSLMNESIYIGQNSNGTWIVTDRCHGKYLVLGGTLWSNVPDNMVEIAKMACNDYRRILRFTPEKSCYIHQTTVSWMLEECRATTKPVIVLTHHAPSYQCIGDKYAGNPLNFNYANDLDYFFQIYSVIQYWFYGHTHNAKLIKLNETTIACNPFGYPHERGSTGYRPANSFPL